MRALLALLRPRAACLHHAGPIPAAVGGPHGKGKSMSLVMNAIILPLTIAPTGCYGECGMGKELHALKVAAIAAAAFIRRTEAEIEDRRQKVEAYRQVVKAWEKASGGARVPEIPGSRSEEVAVGLRAAPGQVKQHVHAVLARGGDYSPKEIVTAIAEQFGAFYSRATVVSILHRGRKQSPPLYLLKEGRWRLRS